MDVTVRADVWEDVVTLLQLAANPTFKVLDPDGKVSIHVNFM